MMYIVNVGRSISPRTTASVPATGRKWGDYHATKLDKTIHTAKHYGTFFFALCKKHCAMRVC